MNITKRIIAVVLCVCLVIAAIYVGNTQNDLALKNIFDGNNSVVIWYTDDSLTDYLNAMAVSYHEKYNVRVIPKLQSGDEYLESVNQASLEGEDIPDLYIISNEALEKAYLSGLATEIKDDNNVINSRNFPTAALNAVTYKNHLVAYPFYFETSALLYNKTYLADMAKNQIVAEESETETDQTEEKNEEASLIDEENVTLTQDEKVETRMKKLIPETFDELLTFADEYDAPAAVEAVFKWDVCDIFYNYFFIGNYMDVGGPCGDNTENIDIYNLNTIKAMQVYQNLNQFFSIESDDIAYDSVIQEFMEGKLVLTTATTDIIKKLDDANKTGDFTFEYGIAEIPDLNDELASKSLSVTNSIVVNGYSGKKSKANKFANYLVCDNTASLYEKSGKIASNLNVTYDNENINVFMKEYSDSVPMPKMMATSNFWIQLEITFAEVWNGSTVTDKLKELSELILTQVTGEPVTEELIEEPKEQTETIEYFDEEAEREAAKQEE